MSELDLVDLGALSASAGGGIAQGDVELLGPGVEGELTDAEKVLAAVVHATRSEADQGIRNVERKLL